jgi:hypothetical protein
MKLMAVSLVSLNTKNKKKKKGKVIPVTDRGGP